MSLTVHTKKSKEIKITYKFSYLEQVFQEPRENAHLKKKKQTFHNIITKNFRPIIGNENKDKARLLLTVHMYVA